MARQALSLEEALQGQASSPATRRPLTLEEVLGDVGQPPVTPAPTRATPPRPIDAITTGARGRGPLPANQLGQQGAPGRVPVGELHATVPALAERIEVYEERNPALARLGQRLEAGAYDALRSGAAIRAADLASFNPELADLLDQIDAGKHPRQLDLPQGPSVLADLARQYYGAGPEERTELRQSYADEFARQVERIIDYGARSAAIPRNPVVSATTEALNERRFGDAWRAFATDPLGFIAQVGVESLPRSVPGLLAAPFVTPPAAFGLTSGASEYGTAIVQGLQDAGVDVRDPQALSAALRTPDVMGRVRENARKRAFIIGGMDALSGGLASRTLAPAALSPVARQVVNVPTQSFAQGALGAAGEAGAQLATGQDLALGDIAAEFAGEFVSAPADVAAASISLWPSRRPLSLEAARARVASQSAPGMPDSGAPLPGDVAPGEAATGQPAPPAVPRSPLPPVPPAKPAAPASVSPTSAAPQNPAITNSTTGAGQQTGNAGGIFPPMESAPGTLPDAFTPNAEPAGGNVVVTPTGRRLNVEYRVVDAGKLIPSHTPDLSVNPAYPQELQPRDRSRAASEAQIAQMAGGLQPELLGRSSSAAEGAPIVGPNGFVESGNARVLAIQRAYQSGRGDAYRRWLAGQGYNIEGMTAPVLVRVRTTDLSPTERIAFATEANQRTTLAPGAAEQAMSDARAMTPALLDAYRGGDLSSAANRNFVRSFIDAIVPASERGAMVSPGGAISQEGLRRIENAVFGRAFGEPALLSALREDTESSIKSIGGALIDAAPAWMQLRADVAAGRTRPEMDVTPAVIEAVNAVSRSRREGVLLSDLVSQSDMLGGGVSSEAQAVLRLMFSDTKFRRPVSRQRLASALTFYADQARKAASGGLDLGDAQAMPETILELARSRGTGELFGTAAELPAVAEMRAGPLTLAQAGERMRSVSLATSPMASRVAMAPGANYTGFVSDVFDPAVPRSKSGPIRRETILRNLAKALGVPFYFGRVQGKGTLGFFRKPVEEVRVGKAGDIETAAHEIAHLLDFRIPEIRKQWFPATAANATIRKELVGVSYDASKLYEGFAEFIRLWSTQANQARAKAPEFFRWWESFVDRSDYGPALRRMQTDMLNWFEQSALDRARSKIGAPPAINDALNSVWDRIRQGVFDDLHGIMQMERSLTGTLSPVGAYETARLTRAAASITEGALTLGAPKVQRDGSHKFVGKGLQQILDPVADRLDDFLMYAVGRSAAELMGQGRERLFSRAEIKAMLALETPEFRKSFDEYQRWNGAILDFAQAKGLIDPNVRAFWRRFDYVPFHRVGQAGPGGNRGAQGNWSGIKTLTGGTENIRDVLTNVISNAHMLISAGLKNEARLKVAELAKARGGARFMAKIPTEDRAVRVSRGEVERAILEALGVNSKRALPVEWQAIVDQITQNMGGFVTFLLRGQAPTGQNVVAALRGGKPEFFEVADPILYRALTALDRKARHWLVRALAVPRRIGQATITLTPDFMAANFFRDTLTGTIMSRHGFRPLLDSARGLKSRLLSDQNYRDFIANGGGLASHLLDERNFRLHLEKFYTRKGIDYRTVLDAPGKLLFAVERLADSFEMATRLGEFRRAIARGEHRRHAAYSAREVSTDFAMRGDDQVVGFLYDTIVFLKAGMNGLDRLYRGLAHDPNRGKIAAMTAMLALASAALYALNRGNPLYDSLEDWDRDNHWHFFIPRPEALQAMEAGQDVPVDERYWHFRSPKIWELGAVASIAERQLEGFLGGQPGEAQLKSLNVIRDLFSLEWLPQAFVPLYELAINRDRFTGRQIETTAMQELAPWARSNAYTSQTVRSLAEHTRELPSAFQISPSQIEHLVEGYFNTWGLYGLTIADGAFFDTKPDMRLDQYPVLRRFYREEPAQQTRWLTELYDAIDAATEARRTMREMDKRIRPEIADALETDPENLLYGQLSFADKRLRVFRQEMQAVYDMRDLAQLQAFADERARVTQNPRLIPNAKTAGAWGDLGALKRLLLDDIVRERNTFAEMVMRDVNVRRGEMEAQRPRSPLTTWMTQPN